ncbi:MAG: hypothetical protein HY741_23520 [Chloroflexi bacterium]|nr:hypothetical protein [Chloroflexota bacterium]
MKRIVNLIQIVLGGIGLVALVVLLNGMFQQQAAVTAARRTPTAASFKPTPKATKPAKVDWENATLEQIQFGKTRTILKQNAQIKIWSWLPDNRRLLIELEDPQSPEVTAHFRIVTLDVKTGEIVEYGRRRDEGSPPLWIAETKSVVFTWDTFPGGQHEIRLGRAGGQVQTIAKGFAGLSVQPGTDNIYYLLVSAQPNALRLTQASQPELAPQIPFAHLSLPWGGAEIDPQGKRLVIIGRPDFQILDLESGELQIYPVAKQRSSELPPVWAMSGAWNPDGKNLAVTLGANFDHGPSFSQLALFDPGSGQVQDLKLPTRWVYEYEWSPKGRFLLAKGGDPKTGDLYPDSFWLVDPRDATFKQLKYFPQVKDSTSTLMAWSAKGQLAWVQNVPEGLGIAITQVRPGR